MKCTYHPTNLASARCSSCDKHLCPACDHRIKGYPYCQDCIVAGVEMLRQKDSTQARPSQGEGKSPVLAVLLGLLPGLGAAYNGQPVKALVHFITTAGLWTLVDVFHSTLQVTCALASFAMYVYSLYDAFRSAQRHRNGIDLGAEDEQLRQFMRARTNLWGGLLIVVGALTTFHIAFPVKTSRFWPLLLVAAGIYLLNEFRRSKAYEPVNTVYRTPPPSVIQSSLENQTREFARADRRADG
ncbi:MAG: hypothetical protein ACKVZH_12520 [Blastocatellia bacterium]